MSAATRPSGLSSTRWLVLVCATVAVVVIGIAKLNDDVAVDDPTGVLASTDGLASTDPHSPLAVAAAPIDVAEDVISRVEATYAPAEMAGEEMPWDAREVVASHIGLPLDPEAETGRSSDDSPSHIGEYLDPDDEHATAGRGEVSHIGEYLDPLADE